jgi:hypothetical protein
MVSALATSLSVYFNVDLTDILRSVQSTWTTVRLVDDASTQRLSGAHQP